MFKKFIYAMPFALLAAASYIVLSEYHSTESLVLIDSVQAQSIEREDIFNKKSISKKNTLTNTVFFNNQNKAKSSKRFVKNKLAQKKSAISSTVLNEDLSSKKYKDKIIAMDVLNFSSEEMQAFQQYRSGQNPSTGAQGVSRDIDKNTVDEKKLDVFSYRVLEFYPGFNANDELIFDPIDWPYVYQSVSGAPDFNINLNAKQKDKVLSLGNYGSIIIEIKNGFIENKEGADFIVYENPFVTLDNKVYAETAIVSVAWENKPENFVYFNCQQDIAPYSGCAGVKPVFYSNENDIEYSGGDAFDLSDVGLEKIKYIKIEDTGDNTAFAIGDEGFDLDAIAIINGKQFTDYQ